MDDTPYLFDYSGDVNEQFRGVLAQARALGREAEVRAEAARLFADLKKNPYKVGESRNVYTAAGIRERFAVYGPLVVFFGVMDTRRAVVISRIWLRAKGW